MSARLNKLVPNAHRTLRADPVMAGLIEVAPAYALPPTALRSPFEALIRAIAHQQLHGVAAERILGRLVTQFGGTGLPAPEALLAANDRELRAVGFSYAKVAALKDLATKTLSGLVPPWEHLNDLADEQIIERLIAVRGVGRWTVEMMLIFQLQRPDVLPVDDFGVRNGFRLAYGLSGMPLPRALAAYGERWKPYRSVAAFYLWRAVELAREQRLPRCRRAPRIAVRALANKVARLKRGLSGRRSGASRPPRPAGARRS